MPFTISLLSKLMSIYISIYSDLPLAFEKYVVYLHGAQLHTHICCLSELLRPYSLSTRFIRFNYFHCILMTDDHPKALHGQAAVVVRPLRRYMLRLLDRDLMAHEYKQDRTHQSIIPHSYIS